MQADALAMRLGLEIGMTLATALAIAKELTHFERDIDAEGKRLAWPGLLSIFLPHQRHAAGRLLVEAGGSLQLFGGLQALANELDARFRHLGHAAQIAVAENPAAQVLRDKDATATLHRVPLACADLSERQQERLANTGLRRPRPTWGAHRSPTKATLFGPRLAAEPKSAVAPPRMDTTRLLCGRPLDPVTAPRESLRSKRAPAIHSGGRHRRLPRRRRRTVRC